MEQGENNPPFFEEQSDFDLLREKIVLYYMQNLTDLEIKDLLSKQTKEGAYKDLDYNSSAKVYWEPLEHLNRLVSLSSAYINPDNAWYEKDEIYNHIKVGLQYYYDTNPQKGSKQDNWYVKTISEPLLFGKILLNMKSGKLQLPDGLINNVLTRWDIQGSTPKEQTSANTTDVAMHRLFFSVLKEDPDILNDALYYLFDAVQYTDDVEGFQYDGSYTFHGRQIYIGGYGEVVLTNVLSVACWVKGTAFEMNPEKVELLRNFILKTFSCVIRGRVMNFNALGRSVSREDYLYKTDIRCEFMRQMAIIDEAHKTEYEAIAARLSGAVSASYMVSPNNHAYFMADYMLHQRPGWTVGIRSFSSRTCRQEVYANNENLQGYFMADGSVSIAVTGEEYGNIMPLWDWNHIPGVTAPVLSQIPIPQDVIGTSTFTGGASDTQYGVYAYDYYDLFSPVMTGARKGWFLFDDEMVCLGTCIQGPHITHTTVDQSWGIGQVEVISSDRISHSFNTLDGYSSDDMLCVVHNGIGYYFPEGGHVELVKKETQGTWKSINVNQSDRTITGQVFMLYLNHHIPNENKDRFSNQYEYIVCPGKSSAEMTQYASDFHLYITNSNEVQAVIDSNRGIAEIVFYEPSSFKWEDLKVTTNKPCALVIRDFLRERGIIYVADLLRDNMPFRITIETENVQREVTISFAANQVYNGSTMKYEL